jgi:hypothetical protein
MPRHPRPRRLVRHGGFPSARAPHVAAASFDPVAALRALVEEGIVAAAALNARDDLELAAASTQRLGALTSGMWRALSRELATAAERLDRSSMDRLEDIERRARSLHVEADDVVAAGVAAMHLAEHRETLETLVKPDNDAHRLLGPNMLFGFNIEVVDEEDDKDDEDEPSPVPVRVSLLLWPAPLTPASVTIVPSLLDGVSLEPENVQLELGLSAPEPLLDALSIASDLSSDRLHQALSNLAVACWTAHQLDEMPPEDEEEEDTDDDVEGDGGPVGPDDDV